MKIATQYYRGMLDDLAVFCTVAEHKSFVRASSALSMSRSMLSYTIKRLEKNLGYSVLSRTSRQVAANQAGQRLIDTLEKSFSAIQEILIEQSLTGKEVSGSLRLTMTNEAYDLIIDPVLDEFQAMYPKAVVEVLIETGYTNIIEAGYDAGLRLGANVQKDMVAIPVGPELQMCVVGSPEYFKINGYPKSPSDLYFHNCINYRMKTSGRLLPWDFHMDGREINIKPNGTLAFNEPQLMLNCALRKKGIAYLLNHKVKKYTESGELIAVLEEYVKPIEKFHLYYPSRNHKSAVLSALVSFLLNHD